MCCCVHDARLAICELRAEAMAEVQLALVANLGPIFLSILQCEFLSQDRREVFIPSSIVCSARCLFDRFLLQFLNSSSCPTMASLLLPSGFKYRSSFSTSAPQCPLEEVDVPSPT